MFWFVIKIKYFRLLTYHKQEDVDSYMERPENDNNASKVIKKLDEDHGKYRFMGLNLIQKKRRLKRQIPDIKESLNIINLMKIKLVRTDDI